jgi:SpoVK/Ycf46/Vps4 family AAA+-type ATPase
VVSKWIGETEKNLSKVFDEAQLSNAIILFDEADALFAKRTEVKSSIDRYANLEVNFLLQRIEAFGGVTILTTNFEDTIDTAFKRRLTFKMHFEKPDSEARTALWEKMFPASCALADDIDFVQLGQMYEMSGGNIRSAALRAAFLAAEADSPITMTLCKQAAEREAREMGLLIRSQAAPIEPADAERPTPESSQGPAPWLPGSSGPSPHLVPITRPRR